MMTNGGWLPAMDLVSIIIYLLIGVVVYLDGVSIDPEIKKNWWIVLLWPIVVVSVLMDMIGKDDS